MFSPVTPRSFPEQSLGFSLFLGRISELSGENTVSRLSIAFSLVLEAQQNKEPVAWLTQEESGFFPPDAQAHGIDLNALAVIRLPDPKAIARAADKLARSNAFGLIVLDLGDAQYFPRPLMSRLNHLSQKHNIAIVCLTRKAAQHASLGALVSLRASTHRTRLSRFYYSCAAHVLKDKRHGPGQHFELSYRAPPGLP
jgi:recombination protein RecA